jgi:predicted oxidoreductase
VYDYSYAHILASVETSLKNLGTDRIDLLLFHRPAPFFDPQEVGRAMDQLLKEGKVLHFGVSNFNPMQFEMLQAHSSIPLLTNQVEISPYCLEHFDNDNINFLLKKNIYPMAWSPLAGGRIFRPQDEKGMRLFDVMTEIKEELGIESIDQLAYAWLLKHPVGIIPITGSGKLDRIKLAVQSLEVDISMEQWYRIYNASKGEELP